MRHRGQLNDDTASTSVSAGTDTVANLTGLLATQPRLPGKHRARATISQIPTQKQPTHDIVDEPAEPTAPVNVAPVRAAAGPVVDVPESARWKASHLPRVLAGTLLAVAALGTSGLGVRYAQGRTGDDLLSFAVGLGVLVILWAVLIASTPQVVTLSGALLTVHNTGGSETFDLSDALQPVDVVGDPRTSHWAVLLHRLNSTTIVLRRNDVIAAELDPIVRHYRRIAEQRYAERDARFNR
jgi:hypothetical protein